MDARYQWRSNRWFVGRVALATSLVVAVLMPRVWADPADEKPIPISAGDYRVLPVHADYDTRSEMNSLIFLMRKVFMGLDKTPESLEKVKRGMRLGIYPTWTQPAQIQNLPTHRNSLIDKMIVTSKNQQAHDEINALLLNDMQVFFRPAASGKEFHPAVRYHAMTIVGSLNSLEAVSVGDNKRPAQPLIPAMEPMLAAVEDPKQIDAVKVAALIGIQRHAEAGIPSASKDLVLKQLAPLIRQKEPPTGRTKSGHQWMQRQAIEIVGAMRHPGPSGVVVTDLKRVLSDDDLPLDMRVSAAEALGKMPPAAVRQAKVDAAEAAGLIGRLAVQSSSTGIEWLEEQMADVPVDEEAALATEDIPLRTGPAAPADEDEEPVLLEEFELFNVMLARRRLKDRLHRTKTGLVGPDGGSGISVIPVPAPQKSAIGDVVAGIDALLAVVDTDNITAAELRVGVVREGSKLERTVAGLIGTPEEEEPADTTPDETPAGPGDGPGPATGPGPGPAPGPGPGPA
jgi:hypothetical protein